MEAFAHVITWRVLWLVACVAGPAFAGGLEGARESVFKVRTVMQEPDYGSPWRLRAQRSGSGTGFYIGENRILTNAHVVAHGRYVTVEREGDSTQYVAEVKFIAHDSDLAMLSLKDPTPLRGVKALELGPLPALHSPVATVGYPMGGEQISITQGIVSRIGYNYYTHPGDRQHLLVQVDSAINPGNSGGPVLQGGEVVGVAFQAFTSAENTGYIIPTPIVRRFLADIADGKYHGHPEGGILVQTDVMNNPSAAAFYGLARGQGVRVVTVLNHTSAAGKILPGDLLTAINDQVIGLDGRIKYESERIDFDILYDLALAGEKVRFDLVRDGKPLEVEVPVEAARPRFQRGNTYPLHPKFVLYGGMVFTGLSRNYLQIWGRNWYQKAPLLLLYLQRNVFFTERFKSAEDIIVISSRLAHPVNSYARDRETAVVDSVDGSVINSFEELVKGLRDAKGPFVRVGLFERDDPLVLAKADAIKAGDEIKKRYGVDLPEWLQGTEVDGTLRDGE